MSLHIDESPDTLSDIKMEISDTTNSLESLGLSPTALGGHNDDDADANDASTVIKRLIEVESHSLRPLTKTATMTSASLPSPLHPLHSHHQNNHNEMPLDDHDHAPVANGLAPDEATTEQRQNNGEDNDSRLLDNRLAVVANAQLAQRPKVLPFEELGSQRQHSIQRTLTSSHPLMSPNGTDSDSECSSRTDAVMAKLHHHQQPSTKHQNFPDVVPHAERLLPQTNANTSSTSTPASRGVPVNGTGGGLHGPAALMNNKLNASRLRAHSPDLLSSESEADVSQYHAAVNANFQTVALVPNAPALGGGGVGVAAPKCQRPTANEAGGGLSISGTRRPRKVCGASGADDISSLDSISNHSFDDDEEHNLASLSPSSSLIDVLEDDDDDDDDDCEGPEFVHDDMGDYDDPYPEATTPTPLHHHQQQPHPQKGGTSESCNGSVAPTSPASASAPAAAADGSLPQYSAAEERRDSRNWQKITLPDGRTREIDMRVIEPYKRVLSHGGYLKAAGQNAIVIFCACHLPDRARADYNYVMDNLFLYVVKTLEQLVTDDYVLIYLHGGTSRRNVPPFPWLKKCYQLLDRRLRKSLKNMYLVHPTFWIKSIVWMARPFVSTKFWRKLVYVKSLDELNTHVAVEKAAIPEKVKQYDAKHN